MFYQLTVLFCVCFRNIVSRFSVEQIDRIVEHVLKMEDKVSGGARGSGSEESVRGERGLSVGTYMQEES